jgi:hypothetical protein
LPTILDPLKQPVALSFEISPSVGAKFIKLDVKENTMTIKKDDGFEKAGNYVIRMTLKTINSDKEIPVRSSHHQLLLLVHEAAKIEVLKKDIEVKED